MNLEIKKGLEFTQSTTNDLKAIFDLYDEAIAYQKVVFNKHWQGFDEGLISREIAEGRQWKIIQDSQIACIFAIDFNDPVIWGEKDNDPSIYLHRIVTNPLFRGNNYVPEIVKWAAQFCKVHAKEFIRLDTWGDNPKLIDYYVKCGFQHVGIITPANSDALPKHYNSISLALFEIPIASLQIY